MEGHIAERGREWVGGEERHFPLSLNLNVKVFHTGGQ